MLLQMWRRQLFQLRSRQLFQLRPRHLLLQLCSQLCLLCVLWHQHIDLEMEVRGKQKQGLSQNQNLIGVEPRFIAQIQNSLMESYSKHEPEQG